ncbi:hypothetical protein [Cupriavidus sp. YAF13]|uniref:hypothetical protein n=1 Tax=Cupriavidus sp. YAF13 TaxID=3233075 RepID=UPI003F919096
MKRAHPPRTPDSRIRRQSAPLPSITGSADDALPSAAPLPSALEPLREAARALPRAAGVYLFHGERSGLPLYIGKSVDLAHACCRICAMPGIRACCGNCVVSTMSAPGTRSGPLLLEARLIKEQLPLFNQRLRRRQQLCSLRLVDGVPEVVYASRIDFACEPDSYGLFSGRHPALDHLRELADAQRLCLHLLGLEPLVVRARRELLRSASSSPAAAALSGAHWYLAC